MIKETIIITILLVSFNQVNASDNRYPILQDGTNCQQIANWYAAKYNMKTVLIIPHTESGKQIIVGGFIGHMINKKMIDGHTYYFAFNEFKPYGKGYYGDYIFDTKEKAEQWYNERVPNYDNNGNNYPVISKVYELSELSNVKYD